MASPTSDAPLKGIRVFDLTKNFAGPYATQVLADLGAEVIKVEDPVRGDETRYLPPFMSDGTSSSFASLNRNKRSVALDLKAGGQTRSAVEALAASCDVFIENLRPGAVDALGLGFERVAELNPKVIYCTISAFGDRGEHAGEPGYDPMIQAFSGLMDITGEPEGPPSRIGTGVIDIGTGMWLALRILAALYAGKNGNAGPTRIDATLVETAAAFQVHHLTAVRNAGASPRRLGTAMHNMAPYEAVTTATEPVMISAGSQKLYEKMCQVIGASNLVTDERFRTNSDRVSRRYELLACIEEKTVGFTAYDLVDALMAAGVPAAAVRSVKDFAYDPQLDAMGYWRRVDGQDWVLPSVALGIDGTQSRDTISALGQDTADVLGSLGHQL